MQKFRRLTGIMALMITTVALIGSISMSAVAQGEGMLYLVEFKANEAGAPMTRDQAVGLLEGLIVPSLDALAKNGKIHAGGLLVGARAGIFIVGAKSHIEVTELVRALPAWGVWEWDVTPLESFAHRAALETKMIQGLRAQK